MPARSISAQRAGRSALVSGIGSRDDRIVRGAIAAAVLVMMLVSSAPAGGAEPWRPGVRRAISYAESRYGSVSFAVIAPDGRMYGYRRAAGVPSASVIKAMFMAAYLRHHSVRNRPLTSSDKYLLGPMVKRSDNYRASRVADFVGPTRMYRLARAAGMRDFHYVRPWGSSTISARDQARFFFNLERYVPRRHEDYARYLLGHIVKPQRWGIARIHRPNWRLFFKGGWGSGTGYTDHQVAFLQRGGKRIAIAMMIMYSPSHDYGKETLRGLAARLLRRLPN